MISRFPLLALVGALVAAGQALAGSMQPADDQARADELRPLQARIAMLGDGGGSAIVYYTVEGLAFRVVTTIGTDRDGDAAPVRLVSYLVPGQRAEVAVAGAVGTDPGVLEIGRVGDRLMVRFASTKPQG